MKLFFFSAALLFASLPGYASAVLGFTEEQVAEFCGPSAFSCEKEGCIECIASEASTTAGKKRVTIDLTGCKAGGIGWACCVGTNDGLANTAGGSCRVTACENDYGVEFSHKCEDMLTMTVEVNDDATSVTINTHDVWAAGHPETTVNTDICGGHPSHGGHCANALNADDWVQVPGLGAGTASPFCLKTVDITSCGGGSPVAPPPVASAPVASPVSPPVQTGGDPHFKTFSGQWFDYHGECDLVFLSAPDFANGLGMDIHVRTTIRYEYSHIEAAALRIGGEIFQLGGWGDYILSGIVGANLPNTISGYKITYEHTSDKVHVFTIHISETERIVMKTVKEMVSITLDQPSEASFGTSVGMLGTYGEGKLLMRDGKTQITNNFNKLGQEWQVLSTEPNLFEAIREPQHPQQCKLPEAGAMQKRRRLGESVMEATARKACQHWGDAIEQCVYDVMATGDLEFADAGAY